MKSLSDIAQEASSFVSEQLQDSYNKYSIEQELRWQSSRKIDGNIMPDLQRRWSVNEEKLILIDCIHHDFSTYAFAFESITQMEKALKSSRFYSLNFRFITDLQFIHFLSIKRLNRYFLYTLLYAVLFLKITVSFQVKLKNFCETIAN